MANAVFFPQDALDEWIVGGTIDLSKGELMIAPEGRRYKVLEAVRVLAEVTGTPDPHKIVGKVKPKADMEKLGAEIMEGSMIIGDNAYDVAQGWMGSPLGTFDEHMKSPERKAARVGMAPFAPKTEEELLGLLLEVK
jgi:hypothetical protein